MSQTQNLPVAVGIDIGSTAVRCVVGLHEEEAPAPSIVGVGRAPSNGVRKGSVVDIEETISAITAAIDDAERISGVTLEGAAVSVNGTHIVTASSRGIVAVGSNNREIDADDLARAEEASTVMQLPPNREVIQIFPRNYIVDGQENVKDPVGMSGMRLEVDTCLVTASTPFLKNTTRSVNQSGLNVNAHIAAPMAAGRAVASKQDKEIGCVVVDIGAHTTGVSIYEEGEPMHAAVLPIGASHVTNDIAIGLRTEVETAEQIKRDHVDADPSADDASQGFTVEEVTGDALNVTNQEVNDIARARLEEIFSLVNAELGKVKRDGMLPGGALLCGGGANLSGITELAKQELRLPAHIKSSHGFSGIVDKIQDPEYSVAVGLMLEDLYNEQKHSGVGGVVTALADIRHFFQDIVGRFRG